MSDKPSSQQKYDTLRLLEGVPHSDEYQAEDIMREFARLATAPAEQPPLQEISLEPPSIPTAEPSPRRAPRGPADVLEDDFWRAPPEGGDDDLWDEIESMGRRRSRPAADPPADTGGKTVRMPSRDDAPAQPPPERPTAKRPPLRAVPSPAQTEAPDSARARRRRLQEAQAQMPKPDIPPERAVRHHRQRAQSLRRRLPLVLILSLLGLYFTLAGSYGWAAPAQPVLNRLLAVLTLLGMVLSIDLVLQTVYQLIHLRFQAEALVLVGTVFTVLDAFASGGEHLPYCILSLLGWLFCLWGAYHRHLALRRTAKALERGCGDYAVRSAPELWNQMDCIVKTQGDPAGFLRRAEEQDYAAQLMQYYVPIAGGGALVLALLITLIQEGNLLQSLAALLTAATPLAGALCFARPFSLLARRLYKNQSALCGWTGAELLGGRQAVVLRDGDLFPEGSVTVNGAKFYDRYDQSYVISCAATVLQEAGGDLQPVFLKMAEEFRTGLGQMTSYRAYESGGYGANIGQDIVLLGTVGFMRLMGIPIPDGTNLRQAVYVAINNELAGLFSINYAPSRTTRNGLDALCGQRQLISLFATRDFILNPSLLRQRFRLTGGRLEFPPVEDRLRLSTPELGAEGACAGLLSRDHFGDYADVVAGGRLLYNLTRGSSLFCLFSGVIGLVLIFCLSWLGETLSATVTNLLLYCLLWSLPPLLITSWVDKY